MGMTGVGIVLAGIGLGLVMYIAALLLVVGAIAMTNLLWNISHGG
jgi:hypothetical protein